MAPNAECAVIGFADLKSPVVLDFEGLPYDDTAISNYLQDHGVIAYAGFARTQRWPTFAAGPPDPITYGMAIGKIFVPNPVLGATMTLPLWFSGDDVWQVGATVFHTGTAPTYPAFPISLSAYDAGDNLLGTVTSAPLREIGPDWDPPITDRQFLGLQFGTPIKRVEFSATLPADYRNYVDYGYPAFFVDHVSFSIPEPASVVVWSVIVLLGTGWHWRRRRRGRT